MKILLAVYKDSEKSGGSFRVAEILVRQLIRNNIQFSIVVAYGSAGRLKELAGSKCHFMDAQSSTDIKAWFKYRLFLRKLKPDIIHYIDDVGWMIAANLLSNIKRINHMHFRPDVGPDARQRKLRIKYLFGTADKIISISHGAKNTLIEKYNIAEEKITVIHNSIDKDYLSKKKHCEFTSEKIKIGMAIRVVDNKGIEDAVKLLSYLPNNYCLMIAGDGPLKAEMISLSKKLELENRIDWLGSVSDIDSFYKSIDYYLFMSWYEGFGLSVAEAMYTRCPVVGLLGDGEINESEYPLITSQNSVLINRSDRFKFGIESNSHIFQELANKIIELENNKDLKNMYITNAEKWVENFSSDLFFRKTLDVYTEVINNSH